MAIAKKTYFLNADKSKTVSEDSKDAAFLLVREGGQISDADAEKYGVETSEPEQITEEPNILISGGPNSGPGIVRGEPIRDLQEGQTGETRVEGPQTARGDAGGTQGSESSSGGKSAGKKGSRR